MRAIKPKAKVPAKLKKLAQELDQMAKDAVEYRREDSSPDAEWCQTFGYGDGDIEFYRLSDELEVKVKALQKLSGNNFRERLTECCSLELTGITTTDDEVFSCCIGEVEEQMDDKLAARVKRLKPFELEQLRRELRECCIGSRAIDCIYLSMDYERWVMRIRESDLDDALKRLGWVENAKAEIENVLLSETPEVRRAAFRLIIGGAA